jgi:predicted mannosyl-3-phosphoglycerate phosphatase (HAD superfamily)
MQDFCAEVMPDPTVANVCEVLSRAHLHEAEKIKLKAAGFIKQNAAAVMATEGWRELQLKHPELVQYIIIEISRSR